MERLSTMETSLPFTVIVPCRGHAEPLRACLRSISLQTRRPEAVVVVDSASDDAVEAAARSFADAEVVRSERPLLAGAARNLGAGHARSPCLAFIDADCVAEPGWLEAAAAAIRAGANVVGGAVLDLYPWHPVAATDNLLQFADSSPHRPAGPASHLPSCSLALQRADFDSLGGFPEDIPVGEDVEFIARAVRAWGAGVRFVPTMRVRHAGRRTLAGLWRHQRVFGYVRGLRGHMLTPSQRRACARLDLIPAVMAWRYWYIARRAWRYRTLTLARALLLSPLLTVALLAYALGLRRGCAAELSEPT
jgi:glycosyltransferase involved in cell wall biosynthesis